MHNPNRETGRTTELMQGAPDGAIFIWCNNDLHYPKKLAAKIGRADLKIHGPEILTHERIQRMRGVNYPAVVLDHGFLWELDREHECLEILRAWARPLEPSHDQR